MNILFYYPSNTRSISLESQMEQFAALGNNVHLVTTEEEGALHKAARAGGIATKSLAVEQSKSWKKYLVHIRRLAKYVKDNEIDLIYANTQPASVVAVFAQYVTSARFIICRHHCDYIYAGTNSNAKRTDRLINLLAKEFIVVSKRVAEQMTTIEGVAPQKIRHIDLGYDFSKYPTPSRERAENIRAAYPCTLLLAIVSRFIECKRYPLLLKAVSNLVKNGYDIQLIIIGNGPLAEDIRRRVRDYSLIDKVHLIGYTTEVLDHMAAADVIVHPSRSEASSNVIKEAGILEKTVIACRDVGDADTYITSGREGILISKTETEKELIEAIKTIYSAPESFKQMGKALKKAVLRRFSIEQVIPQYTEVIGHINSNGHSNDI